MVGTDGIASTIGAISEARLTEPFGYPALPIREAAKDRHRANVPSKRKALENWDCMAVTVLIHNLPVSHPKAFELVHARLMPFAMGSGKSALMSGMGRNGRHVERQ
jgi:hypothetical protein